jgi:hypothetical protein
VELRRCLSSALLLFACGDDDQPRSFITPPILDGSLDASYGDSARPGRDAATCQNSYGFDLDGDGFSTLRGDCDDCDPMLGPAAYDFPGNGVDEDCKNGDAPLSDRLCDADLRADETDAEQAVRAFGLCGPTHGTASGYQGLLTASWQRLDASKTGLGDPRQLWLPEHFGDIMPRQGDRLLVLSTGVARDVDDKAYTAECDHFGTELVANAWTDGVAPPAGFPRDSKACGKTSVSQDALAYDDVVLELSLRAPSNANALAFDSLFLTYEYPDYVCTQYNDFFVVLMDPAPKEADDDDNILFDADDDPVGVNSALLSVCEAAPHRPARAIACEQGPTLLKNTGYAAGEAKCAVPPAGAKDIGGAATGWLHTEMPVRAGKVFKLRFVLWDSGDPLLDSTVLLDNFQFLQTPTATGTMPASSG